MADDGERAAPGASPAQVLGAAPVLDDSTMEDILDKLKLLGYEDGFVRPSGTTFKLLTKTYFAVAAENANAQFFYFTNLVSWLMTQCGHRKFPPPGQFDDPNAVSTNILMELKSMDFTQYVKDIAPNRIRQGHGDAVMTILVLLCDRALIKSGFQFRAIAYPPPATDIEERVGGEADGDATGAAGGAGGDDTIDDRIGMDSESDDEMFTGFGGGASAAKKKTEEMIHAQVDAKEWALEVERVGPMLQYRADEVRDWRTRVENASTLMKAVDKMYPDVKAMLERLGNDLSKTLERIQKREQTLGQQFHEQVEEYRAKLRELNAAQDQFQTASKNVSQLSVELNQVTEALDQVKNEIQGREEKSSDVSPLLQIKEAVQKVKQEIRDMNLRIGVLQHTVLHYTLRTQKAKRAAATGGPSADDVTDKLDSDFSGYL